MPSPISTDEPALKKVRKDGQVCVIVDNGCQLDFDTMASKASVASVEDLRNVLERKRSNQLDISSYKCVDHKELVQILQTLNEKERYSYNFVQIENPKREMPVYVPNVHKGNQTCAKPKGSTSGQLKTLPAAVTNKIEKKFVHKPRPVYPRSKNANHWKVENVEKQKRYLPWYYRNSASTPPFRRNYPSVYTEMNRSLYNPTVSTVSTKNPQLSDRLTAHYSGKAIFTKPVSSCTTTTSNVWPRVSNVHNRLTKTFQTGAPVCEKDIFIHSKSVAYRSQSGLGSAVTSTRTPVTFTNPASHINQMVQVTQPSKTQAFKPNEVASSLQGIPPTGMVSSSQVAQTSQSEIFFQKLGLTSIKNAISTAVSNPVSKDFQVIPAPTAIPAPGPQAPPAPITTPKFQTAPALQTVNQSSLPNQAIFKNVGLPTTANVIPASANFAQRKTATSIFLQEFSLNKNNKLNSRVESRGASPIYKKSKLTSNTHKHILKPMTDSEKNNEKISAAIDEIIILMSELRLLVKPAKKTAIKTKSAPPQAPKKNVGNKFSDINLQKIMLRYPMR